ncbi:MAG TPA: TIGR02147 family protein [Polyangiales bacterium]
MSQQPPARSRSPLDVFKYLDFRQFLADLYELKKRRGYSYRAFSRAAGLGAPNYLKLVVSGQRNLTAAMAERFAATCGLQGDGATYFERLVAFNQAKTTEERNASYAQLAAFRRYRQAHRLEHAQAAYHSKWYLPAIRELCASPDFKPDPRWIASVLRPAIEPAEAKQALDLLVTLGLLTRDEQGRLRQADPVVSTGAETQNMNVRNYHAEMMRRAAAAMELFPATERDISSLTLCVGPLALAQIKQRIQAFRRELIELAEGERGRSQALQINFQLFPLSVAIPARRSSTKPLRGEEP